MTEQGHLLQPRKEAEVGTMLTLWRIEERKHFYQDQYGISHDALVIGDEIQVTVTDMSENMVWSEDDSKEMPMWTLTSIGSDKKHYRRTRGPGRQGTRWSCQEEIEEYERLIEPFKKIREGRGYIDTWYEMPPGVRSQLDARPKYEFVDSSDYYSLSNRLPILRSDGTQAELPKNPYLVNPQNNT